MTTHSFTGFRITTNLSGTPTGFQSSSMKWTTSEYFRFQYNMDAATAGAFSSITMDLPGGSQLISAVINNALRVNLDTVASIGRWTWGGGNQTTVLAIQTSSTQTHYYAMAGAALPTFATTTDFTAFMATVTATTSIIPAVASTFGPRGITQSLIDMSKTRSFTGTVEDDVVQGIDGIDNWSLAPLQLGKGNDQFTGTSGADWAEGGLGNDSLSGANGNDTLVGQEGNDLLFGGAGADSLDGGVGDDMLYGGEGADLLNGAAGNDVLYGGGGSDRLIGGDGNDVLFGDDGRDTIDAGGGNDVVYGGTGGDSISGAAGADFLAGEGDDDRINGGSQNDTLYGGDGNDSLDGGTENDFLFGDAGNDLLNGGSGTDFLDGGTENDTLNGGDGNDTGLGGEGNDTLNGDAGNDMLYGDAGNDLLRGGADNDTLQGGLGDDTLNGGTGADWFVFGPGMGTDTVQDFKSAQLDKIYIGDTLAATAENAFALATQVGSKVVFDFGNGNTLTLNATTLAAVETSIIIWDDALPFVG